jgi:hypothetical protein
MTANSTIWTPTAQYGRQQLMSFRGNSPKIREERRKKELKISHFLSDRFR